MLQMPTICIVDHHAILIVAVSPCLSYVVASAVDQVMSQDIQDFLSVEPSKPKHARRARHARALVLPLPSPGSTWSNFHESRTSIPQHSIVPPIADETKGEGTGFVDSDSEDNQDATVLRQSFMVHPHMYTGSAELRGGISATSPSEVQTIAVVLKYQYLLFSYNGNVAVGKDLCSTPLALSSSTLFSCALLSWLFFNPLIYIVDDQKLLSTRKFLLPHNISFTNGCISGDMGQATQNGVAILDKKEKPIEETMASAASVVSDLDVVLKHLRRNEDNGETGSFPQLPVPRESKHNSSSPQQSVPNEWDTVNATSVVLPSL